MKIIFDKIVAYESVIIVLAILSTVFLFPRETMQITSWDGYIGLGLVIANLAFSIIKKVYQETREDKIILNGIEKFFITKLLAKRKKNNGNTDSNELEKTRDIAISLTYLRKVKEGNIMAKIFLTLSAIIYFTVVEIYQLGNIQPLIIVPLIFYVMILAKEAVLEFRIKNGFFGTTAAEARIMIAFILDNSQDIDFTDGSGKPKKALLSEKLREQRSSVAQGVGVGA